MPGNQTVPSCTHAVLHEHISLADVFADAAHYMLEGVWGL